MNYLLIVVIVITLIAPLVVGGIIYYRKYRQLQKLKEQFVTEKISSIFIPPTPTAKQHTKTDNSVLHNEVESYLEQSEPMPTVINEQDLDQIPMFTPIMNLLPELPR